MVCKEKRVPEDWEYSIIVPIINKRDSENCRGITLISNDGKIYESILEARFREQVEGQLDYRSVMKCL